MSEPRSVSEDKRFFGGFGIADLAMRLAEKRGSELYPKQYLKGFWTVHQQDPTPRHVAFVGEVDWFPVSSEYYRIIDRIARGEAP